MKTPSKKIAVIDQNACADTFSLARRIAGIGLKEVAGHLDISTTTMWRLESDKACGWTPKLYAKAINFVKSKTK